MNDVIWGGRPLPSDVAATAELTTWVKIPPPPPDGKPDTFRRAGPRVGRNAPCQCGSGRKRKACHP